MAKRLFDLVGACAALLLLLPVFLLIGLAIRLDGPGSVFFRQVRVGQGGRPFRIHKFRTMLADAQTPGPLVTVGRDVRITRVGHVLRHYRLDELPQFIDVLQGSMSLVGPRPEVPHFVAHYPPDLKARVLSVRPGITDPASLVYLDEASQLAAAQDPERDYIERILPAKLALQAAYADGASLASDLRVLGRTLRMLVSR